MKHTDPTFVFSPPFSTCFWTNFKDYNHIALLVLLNRKEILARFQLDMESLEHVVWTEKFEEQIPALKGQDMCDSGRKGIL